MDTHDQPAQSRFALLRYIVCVAWFLILVRIYHGALGHDGTSAQEEMGIYFGHALIIAAIVGGVYVVAKLLAKLGNEDRVSPFLVLGGATLVVLALLAGGKYADSMTTMTPKATPEQGAAQSTAEQAWARAITAWRTDNSAFLSDPSRRQAMAAALEDIQRAEPNLSDDDLIKRAEEKAFSSTHWAESPVTAQPARSAQIVDPFAQKVVPYDGSYEPTPPPRPSRIGKHELMVARGLFGGCPTGYVDHPADPDKCVLPMVAERMMRR